jgi:phenylacetate-coenzyme A ligase PaaK-like adenylate-forming protein
VTTITDTRVEALRARAGATLAGRLDAHIERLDWDAGKLERFQRVELRRLLADAVARSPFHARRLRGIDPERFELEQLAGLAVMSKEQMMSSFEELLTDRRLRRARVDGHLAALGTEPRLLDDEYVCLASGGSSGLRGVFVQTLEEYLEFVACVVRRGLAGVIAAGGPPPGGHPIGIVAAAAPVHSSGFGAAIATGYPVRMIPAPATLPVAEVVRRLNDARPPALLAHTSKLLTLAAERRAGRLRIEPRSITAMGETVTPEDRRTIEAAFGIALITQFVATEGLVGHSDPGGEVVSFANDACLVELLDANNQPVPEGVASAKALVTNLHNHTQPPIRYELTDRFIRHPSARNGAVRATVEGRAHDVLHYRDVAADPLAIRTVMVRTPAALEYQARQTPRGIDIAIVAEGELNPTAVTTALAQSLRAAGLPNPQVHVHAVTAIARHPETGKARRFIPLTGSTERAG